MSYTCIIMISSSSTVIIIIIVINVYIYIYMYMCICVYIYTYIYTSALKAWRSPRASAPRMRSTSCARSTPRPSCFRTVSFQNFNMGGFYSVRVMTFHSELYIAQLYDVGCNFCPEAELVSRLDRETSGCLLVPTTASCAAVDIHSCF